MAGFVIVCCCGLATGDDEQEKIDGSYWRNVAQMGQDIILRCLAILKCYGEVAVGLQSNGAQWGDRGIYKKHTLLLEA